MNENIVEADERTCRFPGCQRPAMASEAGTGRPPEYCDDPAHTRAAAWRTRKRMNEDVARASESRPVDSARQRASEITGQVRGMIEHLETQLTVLVEELRTIGDPGAAEAQIESVSTEAAEQVAAANARATRAEQAQRRAEAEKDEADAAAEEATRVSEETAQELAGVQGALDAANAQAEELAVQLANAQGSAAADREEAEAVNARLQADLDAVRAQLGRTERDRDTATARADAEQSARADADQRATVAERRAESESTRADREEATATEARAQLEAVRLDLDGVREAAGDMRSTVATLTAQLAAARTEAERERAHGDRRVEDIRETYGRQVDQLREEFAQAREATATQRRAPRIQNGEQE